MQSSRKPIDAVRNDSPRLDAKRALIDSIPGVYFAYDAHGKLVEWNQGYLDVVGITEEECYGRDTTADIAPEDHDAAERALEELARFGRTTTRAHMVNAKTGERTPFFFSSRTIPTEDGFRIVGLGVDISSTVETEHALRTEQAFFRSVLESSIDGFVVFDRDHVVVAHNRYFPTVNLFDEDPIGQRLSIERVESVAPEIEDSSTFLLHMTRIIEQPLEHHRFTFQVADGPILECASSPVLNDAGDHLGQVLTYRDTTTLAAANRRYEHLATHDAVTGLLNRTASLDVIQDLITEERPFGILALDIDRFERYNHAYGYLFGDEVLRLIGELLEAATDLDHIVGRIGGDEFLIIVPGEDDPQTMHRVATSVFQQLGSGGSLKGRDLDLHAHVGACCYPKHGASAAELISHANYAVSCDRIPGRNSLTVFSDVIGAELNRRITLEQHLRQAISSMDFHLLYQPKVDIDTGRIMGVEALLRWHDPDLGWISSEDFIPLAEETRLILPLGDWILATACAQMKEWLDLGIDGISLAVNVSMVQMYESDFLATVKRTLNETGLAGKYLEIELTETVLARDPERVNTIVNALRSLGVLVSIDDFGKGYSSLSYLKDFQIDKMKIDQSFTRHIQKSDKDNAIMQTAISMARSLKLITIAEGVETREQLAFLREHGCMRAQGYLFSGPVPAPEIVQMFTDVRNGVLHPHSPASRLHNPLTFHP